MQIIGSFFCFAILITPLFGMSTCSVDDRIMFAIASIEKHPTLPVGYPFIISINSRTDQQKARNILMLKKYFLDKRTLDCQSSRMCTKILHELKKRKIINLDCGAYQINYKFWNMEDGDYFNLKKSYYKACEIVMKYNKNKWSWKNIAKFHSKTVKYNNSYKKKLISTIERNMK
jgi:hypothetical protein